MQVKKQQLELDTERSFSPLPFTSLLFTAICKASSGNHFSGTGMTNQIYHFMANRGSNVVADPGPDKTNQEQPEQRGLLHTQAPTGQLCERLQVTQPCWAEGVLTSVRGQSWGAAGACAGTGRRPRQPLRKSLQSCLTLCDPIDGSPPGSAIPGILQAQGGNQTLKRPENRRSYNRGKRLGSYRP